MNFENIAFGKKTEGWTAVETDAVTQIVAGGIDIWKKCDEFLFRYVAFEGDFEFVCNFLSFDKSDLYAKIGLMARAELTPTSPHAFFCAFPDNAKRNKNNGGYEFQYRLVNKKPSFAVYPQNCTCNPPLFEINYPNNWMKLTRNGDTFASFCSKDGINWKEYSSMQIVLPKKLFVGIATTSHSKKQLTFAKCKDISIK